MGHLSVASLTLIIITYKPYLRLLIQTLVINLEAARGENRHGGPQLRLVPAYSSSVTSSTPISRQRQSSNQLVKMARHQTSPTCALPAT